MEIQDVSDPLRAAALLTVQTVRYTPGDGRMYRLSLVPVDPDSVDQLLVITLGINSTNPTILTMRSPRNGAPWDRWSPGRWRATNLPEDLYPAIVAILGALGWADHDPVFSPESVREFDN